jgi:photosynthetic reaction center cytochrome c subunit
MRITLGGAFAIVIGTLLGVAMLTMAGWDAPPPAVDQIGYRGVAMESVTNPRTRESLVANSQMPEAIWPYEESPEGTPLASEVYENVQVLGHLPADQFDRLMAQITEWVSPITDDPPTPGEPERGCNYCHNPENLADDNIYTKVVSRRMLQMTQYINTEWQDHVAQTGVNCYTCHRGQPVPQEIWFTQDQPMRGMVGFRAGQNAPGIASASLPGDPFTPFLLGDQEIRQIGLGALPPPEGPQIGTKATEYTYSLMNHMSEGLGVNCTYCHNSRQFQGWDGAPPARMTAWFGIRMSRALNVDYLEPLGPEYPPHRLGELGDAPKANCATCHQGLNLPLNGAPAYEEFPSLGPAGLAPAANAVVPAGSQAALLGPRRDAAAIE